MNEMKLDVEQEKVSSLALALLVKLGRVRIVEYFWENLAVLLEVTEHLSLRLLLRFVVKMSLEVLVCAHNLGVALSIVHVHESSVVDQRRRTVRMVWHRAL